MGARPNPVAEPVPSWRRWMVLWLLGLGTAVVVNLFWLGDWVSYWWVRGPLGDSAGPPLRRLGLLWEAGLWGGPADRGLALLLLAAGAAGAASIFL